MKVQELMQRTVDTFRKAGIAEPQQDAQILLEYIYHIKPVEYILKKMEELPEDEEGYHQFLKCVNQRCTRKPVQYITGSWSFMGLDFQVNEQVLIPRFDTEILVEEALKRGKASWQEKDERKAQSPVLGENELKKATEGWKVLDMCTGSGCIAISIRHFWKEMTGRTTDCQMTAVDLSKGALEVAKENARRHGLDIRFVESDLFSALDENDKFDMIVSNPPYIPSGEIPDLMPEVATYEPIMALDGAEDGLKFYRLIIEAAPRYLRQDGWLLFEIGCEQGKEVQARMQAAGFEMVEIIKDLAGLDRVVAGRWKCQNA